MKFNKSKCFTKCAALAMTVGMMLPTSAMAADINTAGGTGNVPVTMKSAPAAFSVTVPTALPVTVNAAGVHSSATDATIVNKSHGPVKVSNVDIKGANSWALAPWSTDMTAEKVNTKKIGIELGVKGQALGQTNASGYQFNAQNWPVINGVTADKAGSAAQKLTLEYHTKAPAQSAAIDGTTIANVVFTIGWDTQA